MIKNKKGQVIFSNFILLIVFLVLVAVSGLVAGMIYFNINTFETVLHTVNFPLPIETNNSVGYNNITDFQGILNIVVYPLLGLKSSLPYLVYFMIFGFIIALGISAYLSVKNNVFFIVHILFTFLITYFALLISNAYRSLLTNPFINSMMLDFTIYNKIMLFLPQIIFFTGLLFGVIAFVNLIKPQSANTSSALNYGGEY